MEKIMIPYEPWYWVVIGLVAYALIVTSVTLLAGYFYGKRGANKVLNFPLCSPLVLLVLSVKLLVDLVGAGVGLLGKPARDRRQRLFQDSFEFHPVYHGKPEGEIQKAVNWKLLELARYFKLAIDEQEAARRSGADTTQVDAQVKLAKSAFWSARDRALDNGFKVLNSWKEYLDGSPTSQLKPDDFRAHWTLDYDW